VRNSMFTMRVVLLVGFFPVGVLRLSLRAKCRCCSRRESFSDRRIVPGLHHTSKQRLNADTDTIYSAYGNIRISKIEKMIGLGNRIQ